MQTNFTLFHVKMLLQTEKLPTRIRVTNQNSGHTATETFKFEGKETQAKDMVEAFNLNHGNDVYQGTANHNTAGFYLVYSKKETF